MYTSLPSRDDQNSPDTLPALKKLIKRKSEGVALLPPYLFTTPKWQALLYVRTQDY